MIVIDNYKYSSYIYDNEPPKWLRGKFNTYYLGYSILEVSNENMKTHKQIVLSLETYNELKALKEYGLSFDGLVKRLVKTYKNVILEVR